FPDVWVRLKRAPESLRPRIAAIPGVASGSTRVSFTATLDVPTVEAPALGLFVSIPDVRGASLAQLNLTSGRYVALDGRDEVLAGDQVVKADARAAADTPSAVMVGQGRNIQIVGTGIPLEYH